jgi:glycerophosphoryl diester phosphodiesterase
MLCVGHRGAAALAPENTLEAIHVALAHGADAVEFDVLSDGDQLVLAHSLGERREEGATLDQALELIASSSAGAHVDLKQRGIEARVADALLRHALLDRSVVSSVRPAVLRELRRHDPRVRVGLGYPEDRLGVARHPAAAPAIAMTLTALKRVLPRLIGRWLERSGASAAMIHQALVTPALIRRCHARDAGLWAWTVNDESTAARLSAWGADAIISDDPRILGRSSS